MVELIQRSKSAARRPFLRALSGVIIAVTALGLVGGCGSGSTPINSTSGTPTPAALAHAQIKITWPSTTTPAKNTVNPRLIPAAANSIKISISNGATPITSVVIARPTTGNTTTTTFDQLPVGDLTVKASAYPNADGTGTAQASGTGILTTQVRTTATLGITMDTTITTIKITPSPITEAVGQSDAVVASPQDANGNLVLVQPDSLVFTIDDTSIATVDPTTGVVTGAATGTANLTATDPESTISGTAKINVIAANVAGKATDGGTPVAGVRVDTFDDNGTVLTTTTAIDGTYSLYVPPGQRVLVFAKSGYVTTQQAAVTTATSKTVNAPLTVSATPADTAAPAITLDAPVVSQASGFATITGTILRGDGLGVIIVNGGSASFTINTTTNKFTYTAILQPGPNIIRVASTNNIASTVSDPINVNYAPSGNVFARVTLVWDTPGDLDLHTWGPNSAHSSWHNKVIAAGALDKDDIPGTGPENFTFSSIVAGHYSIGVDDFGATDGTSATVRVSIFTGSKKGTSTSYGPYKFTAANGEDPADYPVTGNTASWWRPIDIDVTAAGDISVSGPNTTTSLPRIQRGNALKKH